MGGGLARARDGVVEDPKEESLREARQKVSSAMESGAGSVQVAATEILRVAGVAAYHTSVILGEKEYYFDSQGIISAPALWSHLLGQSKRPREFKTEVINVGSSAHTGLALAHGLLPFFEKGSYDVLHKNCNVFSDAALYFLTRKRLDGRFSRLERLLVATEPLSTELLNRLLMAEPPKESSSGASAGRLWPGPYMVNPLAQNFTVDDVIAACDAMSAEACGPNAGTTGCTCMLQGWNCGAAGNPEEVAPSHEEGLETALAVEAGDMVDVDETVTRVAALLPLLPPEEPSATNHLGATEDSSAQLEEMRYWEFGDDGIDNDDDEVEAPCTEADHPAVPKRMVPLHEIVGEAWVVELAEQDSAESVPGPPRHCPAWSSKPPVRRVASLDGALTLSTLAELAELAERPESPEGGYSLLSVPQLIPVDDALHRPLEEMLSL